MSANEIRCDVCIVGGGFAGSVQARHLRLKLPNVSVVVIDDRTDEQMEKSRKVGESTVEIAGIFLARDLDLWDYLIENQLPKHGLSFHFRDASGKTDKLTDYISYLSYLGTPMPSWQLDRVSLEKDLMAMNHAAGVQILRPCRVRDIAQEGGGFRLDLESLNGDGPTVVRAEWAIDASGRKGLFNQKLVPDNKEKVTRLNTASFWIRIKNFDRRCFKETVHDRRTMTSVYYSTNHFFGPGHWIWMIPLASGELSVGIVCDKDIVDITTIFKTEKFLAFLEREHKLLYDVCQSGEVVDCLALNHLPYRSKKFYDASGWALISDAGAFLDPFYSNGMTFTSIQVCQVTRMIEVDLVEKAPPEVLQDYVERYDRYFSFNYDVLLTLLEKMYKITGDPRVMQEKIRFDQIVWFKSTVPWFVTKTFLERRYIANSGHGAFLKILEKLNELYLEMKDSDYVPEFIETMITKDVNASEIDRCVFELPCFNMYSGLIYVYRYSIKLRIRLMFGIHGFRAWFKWDQWKWIAISALELFGLRILRFRRGLRLKNEKQPSNTLLGEQGAKFKSFLANRRAVERQGEVNAPAAS